MSANLRLRISTRGGEVTTGLFVALGLGVATALGGCAMNKEQSASDTAMSPAGSCEVQHEEAIQDCQLSWDAQSNQDQLQACMAQADQEFEACRTQ
jgi:hypothetical protein